MSDTNGRIDYSRLVGDIDFGTAFEGTRFEQYTDTENGLGSILGGWLGAILGRFVGMALGEVAQELLVDELFGGPEDDQASGQSDGGDKSTESTNSEETTDEASSDEETAEAETE
ncbi:hypothetical protein halTADL_0897 [Halohasta litchfieldiae]|uniref:Uncharacterized protein n=1 Tax=Halohasta litchfieldiae TaxID=1073996 RepID=A0A1H6TFH4_9EURY|nr:hypothetical protein [Halohasta litchfieldiae]ATW87693.1 hypothetical protein halTADL_0897 [Halohasta litchfieldiae]SEI75857.1 hypothetical protein SAMN05444271_10784 [Halohasta litchfieldiae]